MKVELIASMPTMTDNTPKARNSHQLRRRLVRSSSSRAAGDSGNVRLMVSRSSRQGCITEVGVQAKPLPFPHFFAFQVSRDLRTVAWLAGQSRPWLQAIVNALHEDGPLFVVGRRRDCDSQNYGARAAQSAALEGIYTAVPGP